MEKLILGSGILCMLLACNQQKEANYSAIAKELVPAVLTDDSSDVSYTVEQRMKYYNVPGASIAVFKNGEIVWSAAYGVTQAGTQNEVKPETRFQAASISKAVTGLGVLKLVDEGKLDLDTDVNRYLTSWKIESPFLKKEKVTIRKLLTHTAGTTVSGVMGYEKSDTIPGTTAILNGYRDRPPVELDTVPGARFYYSGGGFVILQQLIEDITGNNFPDYFDKSVFPALGMSHSTFDQFPEDNISSGHDWEGNPYSGGWRVFPSMAAAGLWTTPSDLARFCIAIENAYQGKENAYISQELAREMLNPVKDRGLGVALESAGSDAYFFHGGSNPGAFRDFMVDAYDRRTGIIVMTNAAQGRRLHDDILRSFSNFFQIGIMKSTRVKPAKPEKETLEKLTGKYQLTEALEYPLELSINTKNQLVLYDPNDGMKKTYIPVNDTAFIEIDDGSTISFEANPETSNVNMNFSGIYTFHKL